MIGRCGRTCWNLRQHNLSRRPRHDPCRLGLGASAIGCIRFAVPTDSITPKAISLPARGCFPEGALDPKFVSLVAAVHRTDC